MKRGTIKQKIDSLQARITALQEREKELVQHFIQDGKLDFSAIQEEIPANARMIFLFFLLIPQIIQFY